MSEVAPAGKRSGSASLQGSLLLCSCAELLPAGCWGVGRSAAVCEESGGSGIHFLKRSLIRGDGAGADTIALLQRKEKENATLNRPCVLLLGYKKGMSLALASQPELK